MSDAEKYAAIWVQFLDFQNQIENKFKTEILDVYKERLRNSKRRKPVRNKKNQPDPQKATSIASSAQLSAGAKLAVTALPSIAEEPGTSSSAHANSSTSIRTSQRSAAKRATEITSQQLKQTLNEKLRNPDVGNKRNASNLSLASVSASTSKVSEVEFDKGEKQLDLPECVVVLNRCNNLMIIDEFPPPERIETVEVDSSDVPSQDCFKVPRVPVNRTSQLPASKVSLKKSTSIKGVAEPTEKETEKKTEREESIKPADELDGPKTVDSERNSRIPPPVVEEEKQPNLTKATEIDNSIDMFNPLSASTQGSICFEVEDCHFKVPEKPADVPKTIAPVEDKNEVSAPPRPTRIRTKNKKYNEEEFFSDSFRAKKTSSASRLPMPVGNKPEIMVTEPSVTESTVNESSNVSKKGKKRKSESDGSNSNKSVKLMKDSEDREVNEDKTSGSLLSAKSGGSTESRRAEASSSRTPEPRTRTKTLVKPSVNNLINIDVDPVDIETDVDPPPTEVPSNELPLETPRPEHRMTRTRTRELNKKKANLLNPQQAKANMLKLPGGSDIKGKENKTAYLLKMLQSNEKKNKATPLATNNSLFSPGKNYHSAQKLDSVKKLESSAAKHYIKEDAARLKKQELMKAQTEGAKRKREERELRQIAHKQAVEKKEKERLAKLQREKEEKEKQVAQLKKLKEEQLLQKKQVTEALLKEAEERRLKEEEAKQARIKKQEEEKRRQAEERMKQAEEAKKLHEMRLAQEAKEREISLKEAEKIKKIKLKQNLVNVDSYQLTPGKDELPPKKPKNENDYGLSDAESGDSTDDEKQPKKIIPKWATRSARMNEVIVQTKVHPDLLLAFFPLHVDMKTLENSNVRCRQRASSSVWDTTEYNSRFD